jgi:hypothetical protein
MNASSQIPATGAFVATNGEFAWRRQDIEHALNAIRDSGYSTLGGEVWLITGEHTWDGLIPQRGGGPPAVWSWNTTPRSQGGSWRDYCHRTAAESIQTLRSMSVEEETPPELIAQLRFNVTYVAEPET